MCAPGPCDANMFLIRHKNILIVPILKYLRHRGELKLATHTRVAAAALLLVQGLMKVFIWGAGAGGWAGLGWAGLQQQAGNYSIFSRNFIQHRDTLGRGPL